MCSAPAVRLSLSVCIHTCLCSILHVLLCSLFASQAARTIKCQSAEDIVQMLLMWPLRDAATSVLSRFFLLCVRLYGSLYHTRQKQRAGKLAAILPTCHAPMPISKGPRSLASELPTLRLPYGRLQKTEQILIPCPFCDVGTLSPLCTSHASPASWAVRGKGRHHVSLTDLLCCQFLVVTSHLWASPHHPPAPACTRTSPDLKARP